MEQKQKIAILLFHPLLHKSLVNRRLMDAVSGLEGVTLRVMYDLYPEYYINIREEQSVLLAHDVIIWQHPFYWYSSPSLLKEWIDIVLQHGFAYGREGKALSGKKVMTAITTGGKREVYREGGIRKYSIRQLLAPFELTVKLCNMEYLPPFVVHGTHLIDNAGIEQAVEEYRTVVTSLRDGLFSPGDINEHEYTNDLIR